jgi:antibiotic biosynthesis monooxygenase (ABM) superfamily enzyme
MSHQETSGPTVIVARRVLPGREGEYMAWHEQISRAASGFPGYLSSELQPPNSAHPGEWVTVYSFATAGELSSWLASDERRNIAAAGAHLIEPDVREQHVAALRTAPEPVTVVFSQVIDQDGHQAFNVLYEDVAGRMRSFPGFLGSDLLQPVDGVQEEHVIVASFASRPDLDRWLQSDSRAEWLDKATPVIQGERTINVVGGFGGWFPAVPNRPRGPKRWKQAVAVLLALYPTSLLVL